MQHDKKQGAVAQSAATESTDCAAFVQAVNAGQLILTGLPDDMNMTELAIRYTV